MSTDTIRLAGVIKESIVDGPGLRFTVFCQGCPHNCPGCHNPATHDFAGGYDCNIQTIVEEVRKNPLIKGVTFSGGEPFCQTVEFLTLGKLLKADGINLLAFTGYTYEELLELSSDDKSISGLLDILDILIDGRYQEENRDISLKFRGSSNQRIIDMAATRESGRVVLDEKYMN